MTAAADVPGAGLRSAISFVGLVLSIYAVYVEWKVHHIREAPEEMEEEFTALCDIQAIGASCSQVFQLPQGRMLSYFGIIPEGHVLDVPNAVLGSIYYLYMLLFSQLVPIELTYCLTVAAMSSSVFLAYQLTFVVRELCLLCWSTHVINSTLTWNLFGPGNSVKKQKSV
ncbi:epoxide reductase complex subunit 1 [Seminavis robusta]|uniref:vitamin-K-epoxide reductase (warfarin-sensitive) n=1 Tax=Seminavis robusta TaxID=568900 RepID=A0A9N8HET6_9STRA|nr:epoxide reductase complex subunit 1 [Seminavis robusta]|eukprot:Sro400_g135100.1 epoxide reductase complex subunit 1 (169) ;mRNA; r:30101-30731